MSILIIDNYDSFTYNLVHIFQKISTEEVIVKLNDKIDLEEIDSYSKIVLSPGPGLPNEAGKLNEVIKKYAGKIPILGVCLGHQAIAEVFGAQLVNLNEVYHGIASPMKLMAGDSLFDNIDNSFLAGRYHSWVVNKPLPNNFEILAEDEAGNIMAYVNKKLMLYGVQFHPESILTPEGETLISNWLNIRWQ